jgi:hypothetical protein
MRSEIKNYNDFSFTLEVIRFGSGITGLTPTIQIKRFGASQYWDGSNWDSSPSIFNMVEVDSVNLPGLYIYDFSTGITPIDITVDSKYLVKIEDLSIPLTEYILASYSIGSVSDVINTVDSNIVDWNSTSPTLSKNIDSDLPEVTVAHNTEYVKADISNGILEANIWEPIIDPNTLSSSQAGRDTVARAISSTYLGKIYKTPYDLNTSEDIYSCTHTHASKFYSSSLPSLLELESLVKQDLVLIKGWSGTGTPAMASLSSFKMKIIGAGIDSDGKYLEIVDNSGATKSYSSGSDSVLILNQNTANPEEIANAVWEEPVSGHTTSGTFGLLTRIIAGLVHFNHRIKDTEYDQVGRMTGCRVVVYPSAEDAEADINPLSTIIINSSYNSGNNMQSYIATGE